MRKFITAALLLFLIVAAGYFSACKNNKSEPKDSNTKDSLIKRGDYLANHVAGCIDCHSKRDLAKYSGPVIPGTEGGGGFVFDQKLAMIPGTLYGRNITPDTATGIGGWTDDEILRAMTQGINKKGDTLFPLMPYANFNHMAREDLLSIIAYIRTLKPISNKVPDRQLMMPVSMVYPGSVLQPNVDGNKKPSETDKVAYGGYLVAVADCGTCHSPMTQQGPDRGRIYAGGYPFDGGTFKVNSANITTDSATGIGTWTEDRFMTKFVPYRQETNYNFTAGKENTIMPLSEYAGMTDDDLKAIYAYLRTVKPISNKVEKWPK